MVMSAQHVPTPQTRQLVEMLSFAGYPQAQIAKSLTAEGISVPTLKKHYADELEGSKVRRLAGVAGMAYQMAMGRPATFDRDGNQLTKEIKPNPAMVMFICKTQLGWKETSVLEVTDPSAGARDRLAGTVDKLIATFDGNGRSTPAPPAAPDQERLN